MGNSSSSSSHRHRNRNRRRSRRDITRQPTVRVTAAAAAAEEERGGEQVLHNDSEQPQLQPQQQLPEAAPNSGSTITTTTIMSVSDKVKLKQQVIAHLQSMKKYPNRLRTQKKALSKLRKLCQPGDGKSNNNSSSSSSSSSSTGTGSAEYVCELLLLSKYNGLNQIIDAATRIHGKRNAKIQTNACKIIRALAVYEQQHENEQQQQQQQQVETNCGNNNDGISSNDNTDNANTTTNNNAMTTAVGTMPSPSLSSSISCSSGDSVQAHKQEKEQEQQPETVIPTISAASLVLDAMKNHKRNPSVQYNALMALIQWGSSSSSTPAADENNNNKSKKSNETTKKNAQHILIEQNSIALVELGALDVIWTTSMLNSWHEHNVILQDRALKALLVLALPTDNRSAYVAALGWKALLTTMKNHTTNTKIITKSLKVCRFIATDYPQAVAKRGLATILQIMKHHDMDAPVQRHGCSVILALASHGNCHDVLWKTGSGRDAVLRAMRQHTTDEGIQKTAILVLQRLPAQQPSITGNPTTTITTTTSAAAAAARSSSTAISATAPTLNTHPSTDTNDAIISGLEAMVARLIDPTTPTSAITNIFKGWIRLSIESHTTKLDIIAAKGVEAIIQVMARHTEAASLQRYACQTLASLTTLNETKQLLANHEQGIPVIATAIQQHTTAQATHLVAFHGIVALERLSQLTDNHDKLVVCPTVLPALVRAMLTYHDHVALQQMALNTINKLASISSSRQHPRRRRGGYKLPILQAGGLQAILQAMANHPTHKHIQRNGCMGLMHLHHKKSSVFMVEKGALEALLASMESNPSHAGIQMAALRAIVEITKYNRHLQYWVLTMDGLPQLIGSARTHSSNTHLQELVFTLLLKSTQHCNSNMQRRLVQAGGISTIMTSMREYHPTNASIQSAGFRTLSNLSNSPRDGATIYKSGGWKVIRNAERVCFEDPFVKRYAFTLLVKLVVMFLLHLLLWLLSNLV